MSACVAADAADSLRRRDGLGSGRMKRLNHPRDVQHQMNYELRNFIKIYSLDEFTRKIIGSNELCPYAIKI
jgi:hypothetical protein